MLADRAADLALFPIQVSEDQAKLERAGIEARRLLEGLDRQVDLPGHQMVQAEDEIGRLPDAPAIDPSSLDELVALPRFSAGEADEQRDQHRDEDQIGLHAMA